MRHEPAIRRPPPSARLAVIESHGRHRRSPAVSSALTALAWITLLASSVPWLWIGNSTGYWSGALVIAGVASAWARPLARNVAPVLAAVCVYTAAAAIWRPWMLFASLCLAIVASLLGPSRRLRLAGFVVCASALGTVLSVLMRSRWHAEAERFAALSSGLAFGLAAFGSARRLVLGPPSQRLWLAGCWVILGTWATVRQVILDPLAAPELPAWRMLASALPAQPPPLPYVHSKLMAQLDRLATAGCADAAYAWIFAALAQNSDAEALASHCPRAGRRGVLSAAWSSWVDHGAAVCDAVLAPAAVGAAHLATTQIPALMRLHADLLVRDGQGAAATLAYGRAAVAGDPFANRDAVYELLAAGRRGQAETVGLDHDDPLVHHWLYAQDNSEAAWQAYNHALNFDTLASPMRIGVRLEPGSMLRPIVDPELERWVVVSHGRADIYPQVFLPLPPAASIPSELRLRVRGSNDLTMTLRTSHGQELTYRCGETASTTARPWPPAACLGGWTDILVAPADILSGTLSRIVLGGHFSLAYVALRPRGAW